MRILIFQNSISTVINGRQQTRTVIRPSCLARYTRAIKKLFSQRGRNTDPGLVQQTVQIVTRVARAI